MTSPDIASLTPLQRAFLALEETRARLAVAEGAAREPMAIVGMGCRVPGADDPASFWRLLLAGKDATGPLPDRWDTEAFYDPDPGVPGRIATRAGGFLRSVDGFDPNFFGIAPREAQGMDPQQRLLLEVCWEALENAGQAPDRLSGSRTGVFVGVCSSDYAYLQLKSGDAALLDAHFTSGIAHSIVSGRLSYLLGLQGPSLTIDTACSSSLVAVHLACQALRANDCRMAVAGGVNLILAPDLYIALSHSRMLAPDGRCKTFDAAADGFARGEGCGVVVLKRLRDAVADGDRILALIRGSAVNQDGPSSGLTAPNGPAQEAVIREALTRAGLAPRQIGFVEAHGTGTQLGDPLEVRALGAVFGADRDAARPLLLGSAKTNIGHLEAAAGVTGLLKLVLALRHGIIPPHLHLRAPSSHIPWNELPLEVPTAARPWEPIDGRRIGGVSSFGFSGTNAHVIVEEAPCAPMEAPRVADSGGASHMLALSARTETALRTLAGSYAAAVQERGDWELADICFTANAGRAHFPRRATLVARTTAELQVQLRALAQGDRGQGLRTGAVTQRDPPRVAFLFTGQGAQYAGMAGGLYEAAPVFRAALDRCAQLLAPQLQRPLIEVLFPPAATDSMLDETQYAQPALFAVEFALAELWRSWGIMPSVVMGHSVGEYVAACIAGVFSLEDGLKLMSQRGRLMQSLPAGGTMAAIFAPEVDVARELAAQGGDLSIAAVNGPEQTVVSGPAGAVATLCRCYSERGIRCQPLAVSHAFHSALIEPILDAFEAEVSQTRLVSPRLRLISNVTGQAAAGEDITRPDYWRRHARQTVRFADGLKALEARADCVVEIGPHPTLLSLAGTVLGDDGPRRIASLRKGVPDWEQMLEGLGSLYFMGAPIDWRAVGDGVSRRIVDLPTYPFQRERCWFQARASARATASGRDTGHALLGRRLRGAGVETIYEACVSADAPSFVRQHRVLGHVLLPATAYLETLLACARDVFKSDAVSVEDVTVKEAMLLPDDGTARSMQTICTPLRDGVVAVSVSSLEEGADEGHPWTAHASANLRAANIGSAPATDLQSLRGACPNSIDVRAFYSDLEVRGVNCGPGFRAVGELWSGDSQALAAIELDADLLAQSSGYQLHPVLLEVCLQTLAAALRTPDGEALHLPIGVKRYVQHRRSVARCWSHAAVYPGGGETRQADLRIFDEDGALVAELQGVRLRRVTHDDLERLGERWLDECLYETRWEKAPADGARSEQRVSADHGATHLVAQSWLVFGDRHGTADALAQRLRESGDNCVVARPGKFGLHADTATVEPTSAEDYKRLLAVLRASGREVTGVVHAWSLDIPAWEKTGAEDLAAAENHGVVSAMYLAQALVQTSTPPLWLITRSAQAVDPSDAALAPAQAPIWGLGRTLAFEHAELRCVCIDLECTPTPSEIDGLLSEFRESGGERQVAFRRNERHVARLVRLRRSIPSSNPSIVAGHSSWRLVPQSPGHLDGFRCDPQPRRAPGPGEVEIVVEATALNFKDVLNAREMYPGNTGLLGGECAGRVTATGVGVTHVCSGDAVMAVAAGSFASHVIARAELVQRRPPALTVEEAASFPIAYITAEFCLGHLAGMRSGDRVLIHAAAGDVGMAAVRLAQRAGAEIFATAGSQWKRDLLRTMGVEHVFDSRNSSFAAEILARTGGRGVDIVLNSLAGELVESTFMVLRHGGKFVEIGSRGIKDEAWVAAQNRDWRYFAVDWNDTAAQDPQLVGAMYARLTEQLRAGKLVPLLRHVFTLDQVPRAFQFMAQARHAGKIVLRHASATPLSIRRDGSYLVTGGLSGLGLQVARWLAQRGALRLVLVGRRGVTGEAVSVIEELRANGTEVITEALDISDETAVSTLLTRIRLEGPPLRGVVHSAGVFDDAGLVRQDAHRFARVFAPKVKGSWVLDRLTRRDALDWFIVFSSIAGVLGSPGQCNYSAANAFLDVFAHERRNQGLPALSIDWGAWTDVGAAADRNLTQKLTGQGIGALSPAQGLLALRRLLESGLIQAAVFPVDWKRFLNWSVQGAVPPFFAQIDGVIQPAVNAGVMKPRHVDFPRQLVDALVSRRRPMMAAFVRERALRVLGVDLAKPVDPRSPLGDLGLDSLLAVELRNSLGNALAVSLPATLLFDYPSIEALTDFLLDDVLHLDGKTGSVTAGSAAHGRSATALVGSIEAMSDDEVDKLIAARAQAMT